jgi:hypothetical protein
MRKTEIPPKTAETEERHPSFDPAAVEALRYRASPGAAFYILYRNDETEQAKRRSRGFDPRLSCRFFASCRFPKSVLSGTLCGIMSPAHISA